MNKMKGKKRSTKTLMASDTTHGMVNQQLNQILKNQNQI